MILKMLSGKGRGRVYLKESDLSAVAGRVPEAHVSPSYLYWFGFDDMTTTRPKKDGLSMTKPGGKATYVPEKPCRTHHWRFRAHLGRRRLALLTLIAWAWWQRIGVYS